MTDEEKELAAIAVGKCVQGDDFDPFADPEGFEFASKIAEAVLATLPARDARIRREAREAMREATVLIDEINERKPSRLFYGINQPLHAKLCTIRATLARALATDGDAT